MAPTTTRAGVLLGVNGLAWLQSAETATWIRTKTRPVYPICRWKSITASVPKGSATGLTRATSANSIPIRAKPTKPRATEKSVRKP